MGKAALASDAFRGGVGIDSQLRSAVNQLQGRKLLGVFTSGGALTAGVKATRTQSDGTGNTLIWSALIGGEHGNFIFVNTLRRADFLGPVFDVDVYATTQIAGLTVTADSTTDVVTAAAHGLVTGSPVRFSNSGGALPTGLSASAMYFAVLLTANTFKVATTLANATAATPVVVDITANGTGTNTVRKMTAERYSGCSMVTTHPRYVQRVVNGFSQWVTVADQLSGNAENRPTDTATPAIFASGAGENSLTGLTRGDYVEAVFVQLAAGGVSAPITADVSDTDRFVLTGTSTLAAGDRAILSVLPKPA